MLTGSCPHRGFTLVEILLGLVATSLIAAIVLAVTLRQQRLARALGAIANTRRALHEGADMLRYDLRAAAPAAHGVYAIGPDFIEFRLPTGGSVICGMDPSHSALVIPGRGPAAASLTAWVIAPEASDTVLVLDSSVPDDSVRWRSYVLAAAPSPNGECLGDGRSLIGADSTARAFTLQLTAPLDAGVPVGAALRFVRRVRYERYRAGDGEWYLGYLDCLPTRATPCASVQPVSGPYAPSGIVFQYFDSSGAPTTDPARVSRITISLRAASHSAIQVGGLLAGPFTDSLTFSVVPRN